MGIGKGSDGLIIPFGRLFAINGGDIADKMLSQCDSLRALGFNQDGGDIIAFDVSEGEGEVWITECVIYNGTGNLGGDFVYVSARR